MNSTSAPNDSPIRYKQEFDRFTEIRSTLTLLTYAELMVLSLKYNHGQSDSQIGDVVGISQQRVSDLHLGALEKLRDAGNITIDFLEDLEG